MQYGPHHHASTIFSMFHLFLVHLPQYYLLELLWAFLCDDRNSLQEFVMLSAVEDKV